jgi:hypothetical protein
MCVCVHGDMVASLIFLNLIVSGGKVKTDLYTIKKKAKFHKCQFCDKEFNYASDLKRHNAFKHDVDVQWHKCDMCDYECKEAGNLTKHKAFKHDVNVQWHCCDLCNYKCKQASSLKTHKSLKHGINIQWHKCDMCECKFKTASDRIRHMKRHHEKEYQARRKLQENRIAEVLVAKGWNEYFESDTMPPIGYFKREHQIDFQCAEASLDRKWCRIDFILGYGGGYVFLEVDENQHRFGYNFGDNKAISCDSKRMANVHTSLTIECSQTGMETPSIYWLRYNPDAWHIDGTLIRHPKKEREEALCSFLAMHQLSEPVGIGYAFYDFDNDTGLDVLTADEFPNAFRDVVINLKDFEMCGMCESE